MAIKTAQKNKLKQAEAHAYHLKTSARKMRLVTNLIKGMWAVEAIVQLEHTDKKAAKMVSDVLKSAIANAANNHKLKKENLVVQTITCDEGPKLKRWMPRAQGRATPKRRPMSHLHIILEEKGTGPKRLKRLIKPDKAVKEKKEKLPEAAETKPETDEKGAITQSQTEKTERQFKENKVQNKRRFPNE